MRDPCDTQRMRNLPSRGFFTSLLSLLVTLAAAAQPTPRTIGQAPNRMKVAAPRLNVIQLATRELIVADLGGNGIDLSGDVRTSLVTGSVARMRWTRPQNDDAIVLVDATRLRARGWSLQTAAGVPVDGFVIPRGGLRITDPAGASFIISDSVDLLARLDGNRDGRLDQSDPLWPELTLFRDRNADGTIGADELTRADEVFRSLNVTASGAASADAFGTTHIPAAAQLRDGTTIAIAHAKLAAIE